MALFYRQVRKRIGLTVLTVFVSAVTIGVTLWWNAQLRGIVDTVSAGSPVPPRMVFTACAALLLCAGLAWASALCSGWTCETMAHDLRCGLANHCVSLPIAEIEAMNAGEQVSVLQNEIAEASGFLRDNLFSILDDLIRFLATFSWLLWLNPGLTLLANIPVAFLMVYTAYSSKILESAARETQQANRTMNSFADSLLTAFPVMRLFGAAPLVRAQYNTALARWEAAGVLEEKKRARLMSLSALLSVAPLLLLFLIGGRQILHGEMTVGTLYIFINLSGNITGVMMNISGRIAQFRRFTVNMGRLAPSVSLESTGGRP